MIQVNRKEKIHAKIEEVFQVVTDLDNYDWRSDLSKIVVQEDGKRFTEYTLGGFPTHFKITSFIPNQEYAFTLENKNMKGRWIGLFTSVEDGTLLDFTEEVEIKNAILKLVAKSFLQKQQRIYMQDLRQKLEEKNQ